MNEEEVDNCMNEEKKEERVEEVCCKRSREKNSSPSIQQHAPANLS